MQQTERRFLYTVGKVDGGWHGTHADFQTEELAAQYIDFLRTIDPVSVDSGGYYLDGPGEDDPGFK